MESFPIKVKNTRVIPEQNAVLEEWSNVCENAQFVSQYENRTSGKWPIRLLKNERYLIAAQALIERMSNLKTDRILLLSSKSIEDLFARPRLLCELCNAAKSCYSVQAAKTGSHQRHEKDEAADNRQNPHPDSAGAGSRRSCRLVLFLRTAEVLSVCCCVRLRSYVHRSAFISWLHATDSSQIQQFTSNSGRFCMVVEFLET